MSAAETGEVAPPMPSASKSAANSGAGQTLNTDSTSQQPPAKGAEEIKTYKDKYKTCKKRARELEGVNQELLLKLKKAKKIVDRLKLERAFLLDKVEKFEEYTRSAMPGSGIFSKAAPKTIVGTNVKPSASVGAAAMAAPESLKKKKADPNAPRKPANAFFMFCTEIRESIQKELKNSNQDSSHFDVTKQLGARWKALSEAERGKYFQMYIEDKERYQREMDAYTKGEFNRADADSKKAKELEDSEVEDPVEAGKA
eukprot:Nk52_evm62s207 gene=Nk52_evmTU62s207